MYTAETREECIRLRKENLSINKISEMLNIPFPTIQKWCAENGLGGVRADTRVINPRNKYTNGKYDRLGEAIRKYVDGKPWTYVRGFLNIDSNAIFSCNVCGYEQSISFVTMRHKGRVIRCKNCLQKEKEIKQQQLELKKKEIARQKEDARLSRLRRRPIIQRSMSFCKECGELIGIGRKSICDNCKKAKARLISSESDSKRLELIKNNGKPDLSITLEKIFERDKGICYLCGKPCEHYDLWKFPTKGVDIRMFPTREHVVALANGGTHTLDNIRLAHVSCNSLKGCR